MRGGQKVDDPNAEDTRQALTKYTVDLTARAEAGKLDPVIGRDPEVRQICETAFQAFAKSVLEAVHADGPMLSSNSKVISGVRRSRRRWPACHGTATSTAPTSSTGCFWRATCSTAATRRTGRSSSSPTASLRHTSRTARSSSATRPHGGPSARRCARWVAARGRASPSTRSCSSARAR